jgi:hypothetical protein
VRTLSNLTAVATLVAVATLAAGCNGDDSSTASDPEGAGSSSASGSSPASSPADSTSSAPATEDPGLTVTDGISPDELLACLTGAGLDAENTGSVPAGVDVPVAEIELHGMANYSGDPDQGGYLYVFADPATAEAEAAVVTLGGSDDHDNSRFAIHQNVVRALSVIVSEAAPSKDEQALFGCLPPASQHGEG